MWEIKGWTSSGFTARRGDGEMVFIYKRPDWGTGLCGTRAFFELRNRGELVGRILADPRRPEIRAEWLAGPDRPVNEADLLEIADALKL